MTAATEEVSDTLHLELRNQVSEIERLASALQAFGQSQPIHARTLYAANLAAEELAINLISY
ncbi:MAG: hypothetical protein EP309_04915, partial [Gammaproteobacteria bacterium]